MKEYRRPMAWNWWLQQRAYTLFMLREFTALFVGGYALFLLALLYRAATGGLPEFVAGLRAPLAILLHVVTFAMVTYHAVTWIHSTPKIMLFWRGEERVSPARIVAIQYAAWALISVAVIAIALESAG